MADVNLTYSTIARDYLLREGLPPDLVIKTGSPMREVLQHYRDRLSLDFDYQNIQLMGGLRNGMPITFMAICLASAALMGLPLSSGYLSKDAILIAAFEWAGSRDGIFKMIPYIMVITSWLTVFYISRLVFKVFLSTPKLMSREQADQIQDAPKQMSFILVILAFFCLFFAFAFNPFSFESSWLWNGFSSNLICSVEIIVAVVLLSFVVNVKVYPSFKYLELSIASCFVSFAIFLNLSIAVLDKNILLSPSINTLILLFINN
jgi:NADH:ubiquinone oxidoreductase subunit 5 (subunit L)/multisubunit Na+/H+ antiporter MnhA subunit